MGRGQSARGGRGGGGGGGGGGKRPASADAPAEPRPGPGASDLAAGGGRPSGGPPSAAASAGAAANAQVLDGGVLEGGGQILRNAAALAVLLRRPLLVHAVRAGREKPGLRPQHLTGLQLLAGLCGGALVGGEVGSSEVALLPGGGGPRAGHWVADTQTAGSCTLLAQAALPALLLLLLHPSPPAGAGPGQGQGQGLLPAPPWAPEGAGPGSRLELLGGTDAPQAPPVDFLRFVLLPALRRGFGPALAGLGLRLERRGYFPRGGGRVLMHVPAIEGPLPPLEMTQRGEVVRVTAHAYAAGKWPPDTGGRLLQAARRALRGDAAAGLRAVPLDEHDGRDGGAEASVGDSAGLLLVAETSTGCLLAGSAAAEKRGESPEAVGAAAAARLLEALASGGCADEHLQDQLVIFMAAAGGTSRLLIGPPTLHTRTAAWVMHQMLGVEISLAPAPAELRAPPGAVLLTCKGAGLTAAGLAGEAPLAARAAGGAGPPPGAGAEPAAAAVGEPEAAAAAVAG